MASHNTVESPITGTIQAILDSNVGLASAGVTLLIGGLGVLSSVYLYRSEKRKQLRTKAENRYKRAQKNIEDLRRQLERMTINSALTDLTFQELHDALQTGKVTATDVLRAYQLKALKVNDRTNAVVDIIKSAEDVAAELDRLPAEKRGPLHGIPISVKETCGLQGEDCTAGLAEHVDKPLEMDSFLIQVIRSKGAIPFVRTNIPQGVISGTCDNPIYGVTVNPHDPTRNPGGSSGGEGALIGGLGSILGIGSDIGGSVRIPASYCGCCSMKPTAGRLGFIGNIDFGNGNGENVVLPTDGPMGRDVTSLIHFLKAAICQELFDLEPSIPRIPFDHQMFESTRPLRIGYFVDNGYIRPVPAVERAVLIAKSALEDAGHQLVEFDIKPFVGPAFCDVLVPSFCGDGAASYKRFVRYDQVSPSLDEFIRFNDCGTSTLSWLLWKIQRKPLLITSPFQMKRCRTVIDWFDLSIKAAEVQLTLAQEFKKRQVDVVLCPGLPNPALSLGLDLHLLDLYSYTGLWNAVNFPAGVLPVTNVNSSDVAKTLDPTKYPAKGPAEKVLQAEARGSEGLPVAVQVVGLPYTEETVLRVMAEIESQIKA